MKQMFAFKIKHIAIDFKKKVKNFVIDCKQKQSNVNFCQILSHQGIVEVGKIKAFQNEGNKASKMLHGNDDSWQKMTKMLAHQMIVVIAQITERFFVLVLHG